MMSRTIHCLTHSRNPNQIKSISKFLFFQGFYRGNFVALKKVHKRSIDLTRSIKKELKLMREARLHLNLKFMLCFH